MYGTADGVYISNLWEPQREPMKVLALQDVTQVDVLEDYQLLIVLAGASCRLSALCVSNLTSRTPGYRGTSDHLPT